MATRIKGTEMEADDSIQTSGSMVEEESAFVGMSSRKEKKGGMLMKLVIVVLVLSAASSAYLYSQVKKLGQDPTAANLAKINQEVTRVGNLMVLPEGETPTLATINDLSKLAGQPFFEHAKVGDEVLLYPAAKKAILFDPKANIIIEVASINLGQ